MRAVVAGAIVGGLIGPVAQTPAFAAPMSTRTSSATPAQTLPVVPLVLPHPALKLPTAALVLPTRDLAGIATVKPRPKAIDVTLDANLLFAKDSAVIRPAVRSRLVEVARQLQKQGRGRLLVQGYTDDLGSAQHGLVLSRQRANAVTKLLRPFFPPGKVSFVVQGLGESNFVAPNNSEANRRKNRRVELHFTSR